MYWQKRFDRENPDKQLEDEITKIHIENKDYGYRRVYRELRNRKIFVNKKKVQRIMKKLGLQVTSFTRKAESIIHTKVKWEKRSKIEFVEDFIHRFPIRKLLQIQPNSSIMK